MIISPPRRHLASMLTALTLPLALTGCVCPDDQWGNGPGGGYTDDQSWPPPTAANPGSGSLPQRDAGAAPVRDAGAGTDVTTPRPDAGTDVTTPRPDVGGDVTAPRPDAGATAPDAHACPTNACTPMPVCQFDNQCGAGGRCRNGLCERGCTAASSCGTGQTCDRGFCMTPPTSGGQCVYDRDCGASATCINGVCHARCANDAGCVAGLDRCVAGVCRPDVGPRPQCRASAECPAGQGCINAVCRTPCVTDVECCEGSSGSICRSGVCVTAHEAAPECRMADQCGPAQSCIDGACAVL